MQYGCVQHQRSSLHDLVTIAGRVPCRMRMAMLPCDCAQHMFQNSRSPLHANQPAFKEVSTGEGTILRYEFTLALFLHFAVQVHQNEHRVASSKGRRLERGRPHRRQKRGLSSICASPRLLAPRLSRPTRRARRKAAARRRAPQSLCSGYALDVVYARVYTR